MFKTLLIANRGEIAVRIMRTCRRLGVRTVAVYSEADRHALHVAQADSACLIGPADAARSYLNAEAIVAAARRCGADAVHPGYGFLSESLVLIDACERAGLVFIGPSREAIRLMGSKIEAKQIAHAAGVPTVPGYQGEDQSLAALTAAAELIGYPLLIKASAGGGGKGMRVVRSAAEFAANLEVVQREAQAAFSDGAVLLERYLSEPRHIEVQLLGDRHGHLLHLFERECSIQRNHQKIIEEAPAAHLKEEQREMLYRHALVVAEAIRYDSTGTAEFMLDRDSGAIYFLEMNTRLQVEHPVTEMICGLDLVEWQLRVAAGEVLPFAQSDIVRNGWAIEARVCAENPAAEFSPETGSVLLYREPGGTGIPTVRVDSGIAAGSQVSPYYDSLLAKVIVHADERSFVARHLAHALDEFAIVGVGTNLAFLADILRRPEFAETLSTRFLERAFPGGWHMAMDESDLDTAAAAVACLLDASKQDAGHSSPWQSLGAWRVLEHAGHPGKNALLLIDENGEERRIAVSGVSGQYLVEFAECAIPTYAVGMAGGILFLEIAGAARRYQTLVAPDQITLGNAGRRRVWRRTSRWTRALTNRTDAATGNQIIANMPGTVTAVHTAPGDSVQAGAVLVLIESMKIVQSLVAPVAGFVKVLHCRTGDTVSKGDLLVEITTEDDA
ncbi:MAG: ATP-grasp domain-containing protein [Betaproteobacteria bacterium]|nr:ATP-grasp domain-containing protein [Betaproteobacteria bacterium]